MIIRGMNIISR